MRYILALDQGTTSSRALLVNEQGEIAKISQREIQIKSFKDGWVEQDPLEIWNSQKEVALDVIKKSGIKKSDIKSIGITNQRETTILWNRKTGDPVYPAINWQDKRTNKICTTLSSEFEKTVSQKTGLIIHPYFSATKISWILEHIKDRKDNQVNDLLFGTVDSWILWHLTGGKVHKTDFTNASRSMLCNIHTKEWDSELLSIFKIPAHILPIIQPSCSYFGEAEGEFPGIPIHGIAGDQHAALLGQACIKPGMIKNTYGTGCFILMHTGSKPKVSEHKLLSTPATNFEQSTNYALEGSIFISGAAVQWLRDGLKIIRTSKEIESLSESVKDSNGLYFVPAFSGLGAPYWDTSASGTITGINSSTTSAHLARATLESIAFQTADVIFAMQQDSKMQIKELRVDGGGAVNNLLLQFQADILDIPVSRPSIQESTALGASYLAGLGVNIWKSEQELSSLWKLDKVFEPEMKPSMREELLDGWHTAIEKARKS